MRGLRSLVVLIVVAAALGGYLYYDSKHDAGSEGPKQDKVFAGVQSDKIDQITVKAASGDQTTVKKQGGAWQVTAPAAVPADEAEVSGMTSNLASMEVQRVVDEQASDVKQYGLDPPHIEVSFDAGGTQRKLLFGQKTPTGSDMYAKVPDKPRVFLVASYLEATFNKSSFDLRDKTILKVDRDKVDRLEIDLPDRTTKFAKQGSDWRLTSPGEARRFRRHRRDPRPPQLDADEVDRRARGDRPEEAAGVRARQAGRHGARRLRQLGRGAGDRQERRRGRRLCQGPVAAAGVHRRNRARRRAEEAGRRLPRQGSL